MVTSRIKKRLSFLFMNFFAGISRRPVVLDMDWYRWDLGRFWNVLPEHPEFRKHFTYMRIEPHDIITPDAHKWALQYVNQHVKSIDDLSQLNYAGYSVWQIAKGCILAHANVPHFKALQEKHFNTAIAIIIDVLVLLKFLPNLFCRIRPNAVIVYEGVRSYSRAIIESARACGVRPIAIGNCSLRPGYLFFDSLTGMIVNRHLLAKCGRELLEVRTFTEEQRKKAFQTWQNGITDKMDQHRTGGIDTHDEIRQALDIPLDKPLALFLAQVRNDASVIYDSPLYDDPIDFIIDTIKLFISRFSEWILLVRLHPKEAGGSAPGGYKFNYETKREIEKRGYVSKGNIRIIAEKSYNTFTLMNMAKIGITEISQAGLEMAMLGKPVVTAGDAFYGRKGFTWDVSHALTLHSMISNAMRCAENISTCKSVREQSLNFAYMLFFEELVANDLSQNACKVMRTLKGC